VAGQASGASDATTPVWQHDDLIFFWDEYQPYIGMGIALQNMSPAMGWSPKSSGWQCGGARRMDSLGEEFLSFLPLGNETILPHEE
jgi:hypothetical protein